MEQKMQANSEAGFSLIELMFVIIILGVLLSMATLTYSGIQTKITTDLVKVDLKVIGAAARTYYLNNQTFPPDIVTLVTASYLDELPKDKFIPGGNIGYKFVASSNPFKIWSVGPNGVDNSGVNDGGAADDVVLTFGP
jgi:prepilin-type N-terminal cleavage/methylation domain-containing protein